MGRKSKHNNRNNKPRTTNSSETKPHRPLNPTVVNRRKNLKIPFSRLTRRFYIPLLLTVILGSFIVLTLYKKHAHINGNVVFLGSTSFIYNNSQVPDSDEVRVSPICGCMFDRPHRGVEFFTNSFDISTEYKNVEATGTQFYITSPLQNMYPDPGFYFKTKIYFLNEDLSFNTRQELKELINDEDEFDKKSNLPIATVVSINKPSIPKATPKRIYKKIERERTTSIIVTCGDNTLHTELLGDYPIAALIPIKNSKVSIVKDKLSNFNKLSKFYIQHTFDKVSDTSIEWEFPMIDVIGKQVAFVCDPRTLLLDNTFYKVSDFRDSFKTCVIFIDVGFSARITTTSSVPMVEKRIAEDRRKVVNLYEIGSLFIAPEPFTDEEFKVLKNSIDSNSYVDGHAEMIGLNGAAMTGWGLPSLSDVNGIYFYGQGLTNVKCDEAIGVCQYGNRTYNLDPSKRIELRSLNNFSFNDEPIISPISLDRSAKFETKFNGEGDLYLDDEFKGERLIDNELMLHFSIILGIISAIISIIGLYTDLRKSTPISL